MGHAKEFIMGDPNDEQNVYHWKEVRLNLPGSSDYDPSLAWVAKVREDGRVAVDLFIYMDDLRPMGPDAEECWRASRKAASVCKCVGVQDAPRKRREVSRAPGPWAGSMVYTDDSSAGVRILVSRKKWAKAKRLLATLHELVLAFEWVDHKVLERIRGFLVYVARTYKPLAPFLMGLHMSIDGWRPGSDGEGWRLRQAEVGASRDEKEESDEEGLHPMGTNLPPGRVKAVPRLLPDLKVMMELTAAEDPPLRRVRARSKVNILYCYRDASGSGFGWSICARTYISYVNMIISLTYLWFACIRAMPRFT
jgi:hypothetical protein